MIFSALSFAGLLYLARLCVTNASDSAGSGCVQLDEYTFEKLISRFEASIVKFDVAYPYGDKENAYLELSKSARLNDDLLVAAVGVKDYGDKENQELAKKYGIGKDDFPAVLLFLKGTPDPISFPKESEFTLDGLRKFLKEKAAIHITLEGCIPKLDKLAYIFMNADSDKRISISNSVETLSYSDKKEINAHKIYKVVMKKVIEKGASFILTEIKRVKKLLEGKINADKMKELNLRLNVLQAFEFGPQTNDEL